MSRVLCMEPDGDPRDHEAIRVPMPLAIDRAIAFIDRTTRHPMRIVGLNRSRRIRRINEGIDDGHGRRGADLARELRGVAYELPAEDFELLIQACELHTDGLLDGDITVRTCWDADRLDLGRVGTTPRVEKLCTDAARDPGLREWAVKRGEGLIVPALVSSEWDVQLR